MAFQIFLIVFSVIVITRALRQYNKKEVSRYWVIAWSLVWCVVIGVALMPQGTDAIAEAVGVGRGADLLVYLSVVFLLYAVHRLMVREQKTREEMTELVRAIAIDRAKHE